MLKTMFRRSNFRLQIYETPFLAVIALIILISVWRCFYFPPTSEDVTTGAEVLAEYAVREKTMINSVFRLMPEGNTLKPPFITCLQIIYKYAGFPFGQLWLCNIFICFIIILYHILSLTLHRIITGLLIIFFLAIPEMYAYTFMILYDYSNAVFFFLSVYFLIGFFKNQQLNHLAFSGLLMGIATYIRPETLLLSGLMVPVILWHNVRHKTGFRKQVITNTLFVAPAFLFYTIAVYIYINYYLPQAYNITDQINPHLLNIKSALQRFTVTNKTLIFGAEGIIHYSYFIYIFLWLFLLELVLTRRFNDTAKNYLYGIILIYLTFPLLSHALPGVTIEYTVKRAFFKLFPLMLLYLGNNSVLIDLSVRISRWELQRKE